MHSSQRIAAIQQERVRAHVGRSDANAFFNLPTGPQLLERIEALLPEHRERVFPPTETLAMFLAQASSADGSCRQAANDAWVKCLLGGLSPCSANTSAHCQARGRLPLEMISTLACQVGELVAGGAPPWWHWWGRRARLVNGATVSLADTEENEAAYPPPRSQQPGSGFPLCRVVGVLCLGSGALLAAASGPREGKGSDEHSLRREILDAVQSGDVLLGDALFATYFLLCELVRAGYSSSTGRGTGFSEGERLGGLDHLMVLTKPKKSDWMSEYEYAQAPATLTVRELQSGGKILVTTFLCPKDTPHPQGCAQGIVSPALARRAGPEEHQEHLAAKKRACAVGLFSPSNDTRSTIGHGRGLGGIVAQGDLRQAGGRWIDRAPSSRESGTD